jgi:hypothetical protein
MIIFDKTISRHKQIISKDNLIDVLISVAKKNEKYITELIRDQIYEEGKAGDEVLKRQGSRFYPYVPFYEQIKKEKGIYQGHVDFNFTGNFHKHWELIFSKDGFSITNTADVAQELRDNYNDFERLSEKRKKQMVDEFKPEIRKKLNEQLQNI